MEPILPFLFISKLEDIIMYIYIVWFYHDIPLANQVFSHFDGQFLTLFNRNVFQLVLI